MAAFGERDDIFYSLFKKSDFMDRCAFEEGWLGNSEYDVVHNPRSWAQLLKVKIVLWWNVVNMKVNTIVRFE